MSMVEVGGVQHDPVNVIHAQTRTSGKLIRHAPGRQLARSSTYFRRWDARTRARSLGLLAGDSGLDHTGNGIASRATETGEPNGG
jgi:hypothetical protein